MNPERTRRGRRGSGDGRGTGDQRSDSLRGHEVGKEARPFNGLVTSLWKPKLVGKNFLFNKKISSNLLTPKYTTHNIMDYSETSYGIIVEVPR